MVQTQSNQAGHPEEYARRVGVGAGASGTAIPTVPLAEYEALKKQNEENQKALAEMATLLQQLIPQAQLPPTLRAYAQSAQSGGVPERRDDVQQSHHQHTQVPEQLNPPPRPERFNVPVPDARVEARRDSYQEVVESTCRGEPRAPPKKAEVEPQSSMSVREAADVRKMIEEVLERKKLVPAEEEQQRARAPFTKEVMGKPLPPKFKMPSLPTFSGKEDPYEHVQNYEAIMMLHGWEDAIMCRAFPITLKDHARSWFNGLKEASLSCFDQLRKEFINAFIINSRRKKDATYLLSVRQSEKETLRQYVDRFRNATLEVHDLQPGVAVAAMLQGTRSVQVQKSLSLDQPKTLADLFVRANKYILQAEVMKIVVAKEDKEKKRNDREAQEEPNRRKKSRES